MRSRVPFVVPRLAAGSEPRIFGELPWVRFPHGGSSFETAVQNTRTLIAAARDAGVKRIVHVSIANPSLESQLGYYRGKAQLEQAVIDSGLSSAIVRPTVIFGVEDILINNIAWFVRRVLHP